MHMYIQKYWRAISLIQNIKTIERIDKIAWAEEVRSIGMEVDKIAAFGSVRFGHRSLA